MTVTKEQVDEVFENATEPGDYIVGIVKLAVPEDEWDRAESIDLMKVGKAVHKHMFDKAIEFDKFYKQKKGQDTYLTGGYMLNYGPSVDESLGDWEVKKPKVTYKKETVSSL